MSNIVLQIQLIKYKETIEHIFQMEYIDFSKECIVQFP